MLGFVRIVNQKNCVSNGRKKLRSSFLGKLPLVLISYFQTRTFDWI